jgi:hypothetical protein
LKYTHKNIRSGEEQNKLKNDKTVKEEPNPLPKPDPLHDTPAVQEVPTKPPKLVRQTSIMQAVITPDMVRDHRKQMIIDRINLRQNKMVNLFVNRIFVVTKILIHYIYIAIMPVK